MLSILKRNKPDVNVIYEDVLGKALNPLLYTQYGVPDTPYGRFQMIALHAAPYFNDFIRTGEKRKSQALFDIIFRDIELSFREIGVGDLSVPKKMKKYMRQMNALIHAHSAVNADHVEITRFNVFGDDDSLDNGFAQYINGLFE